MLCILLLFRPLKQLWKALLAKDDINMTLVRKQLSLRSADLSRLFLYYCPNQAFSEIRIEPNASLKDKLIVEFANKFVRMKFYIQILKTLSKYNI